MEQFKITPEDLKAYSKSKKKLPGEDRFPGNTPKRAVELYSLTHDGMKEKKGTKINVYDEIMD